MSIALDAGEMLAQEAVDIGPEETAGELEARLAEVGARLAVKVVDQIVAGTAQGVKQDKSQATKAPKLTKEHGLIDWSRPGRDVCNQIRAMQPWPTAYTFWHRHQEGEAPAEPMRLIVNRARVAPASGVSDDPGTGALTRPARQNPAPGEILSSSDSVQLLVAAGDQTPVEILELQPAGKRRMPVAEFLRGHRLQPGDRFGPVVP
jgi:methionyl-tRNA formyltransferase